jgi:hypothetical protein
LFAESSLLRPFGCTVRASEVDDRVGRADRVGPVVLLEGQDLDRRPGEPPTRQRGDLTVRASHGDRRLAALPCASRSHRWTIHTVKTAPAASSPITASETRSYRELAPCRFRAPWPAPPGRLRPGIGAAAPEIPLLGDLHRGRRTPSSLRPPSFRERRDRVPVAPIGTPGRGRRGRWDRASSRRAPQCGSAVMAPRRSRPFAGVALLRFDQAHGERDRNELRLRADVELAHRVA